MKAVIMAGGLGTRLRPLTCNVPKPMVPVLNRPILEHTVTLLKKHRITEVIFLLYFQPESITNFFGDGSRFGVKANYVVASHDYGTAGAVKQATDLLDDTCLVLSGDAVTDLNLTRFVAFHKQKGALVSLALSRVGNPSPFGIAITDDDHRITRFLEKPSWGQIFSDTVNMGIYVLEPEALQYIPTKTESFFAKDLFPKLVRDGSPIYGFLDECYWKDIGDLRTYQVVHWDAFDNKISLEITSKKDAVRHGKGCAIGTDVTFEGRVLIGDNCRIEDGVVLSDSAVGSNCQIGKKSVLRNTILWQHVVVGARSELNYDVVASRSRIGNGCTLDENVYISDHTEIGSNTRINANVKIWPGKEVDEGSEVNSSLVWGDKWQRELFTDARVTGLANLEASPEFAARLGAAFGARIGKTNDVLVSRDATPAARMVYRSLMSGLMSAGVHVKDLQVAPIPIVRYNLHTTKEVGGVHVRRSPFEKKLLDIMFFDRHGRDISPGTAKLIERIFYREDFPRVAFDEVGDIDYPVRMSHAYVENFLTHLKDSPLQSSKFRIVIDYSHGSATQVFPNILGSLNCEVISLNANQDAQKLTHTASSFDRALKQLAKIVKSTGADAGFWLDAGAEKVYSVDERGRIIPGERLAVLVTRLCFDLSQPRKIAARVTAPRQVETLASSSGVPLVYTPDDGGALIKATEDPEVDFAVDTKGGFIFPEFHFAFDGMFSVIKILELLARKGQSLGEIQDKTPSRALAVSRVPCPWEAKGRVMRHLETFTKDKERVAIDGVKIYLNNSWVLVIPHKDKACYHVMADAQDAVKAKKLVEKFRKKVLAWKDS